MMANIGNEGTESRMASITVDRPKADETLTVAVTPGLRVVLEFNPAAARFAVEGDDFVLTLEDGGQVVFAGLISAAQGGDAPTLHVAGIDIDAGMLMEQVLALAEDAEAEPIETAAGEAGEGEEGGEEEAADGGGTDYDDSFGELIAGLIQQGVIGETELGFGLIGSGGTEFLVEAEFLSEGHTPSGGGFGPLGVGAPSGPGPLVGTPVPRNDVGSPDPLPDLASVSGGDEVTAYNIPVYGMDMITNEATGNLEIPDELILYLATTDHGAGLSVTGPSNGGGNNASIWDFGGTEPGSPNTWANHVTDNVKFHLGGGGAPTYEGSLTYEVADGSGGTGEGTIGVRNVETENDRGYWTLDRTGYEEGEVLLGLDGRNKITGGDGDDIIHGGHDSSGDILIGGGGGDVIFGGSGNDDLQGDAGDDTFIMRAGFGRDTVNGGADSDTISLESVLTDADVASNAAISDWLTADQGFTHDAATDTITFDTTASGTIDLGGGNEITFVNIEQIVYTGVA